ncbi:MAG: Ig-like domain-containing protein [Bryobacteraceae bacterium]
MNYRKSILKAGMLAAISIAMAAPSFAVVYNLTAGSTTVAMPDGTPVTMWGYGLDAGPIQVPGPVLTVPAGDTTLTINLTNNLSVPTSIIIPGQKAALAPQTFTDPQGRTRVRAFTIEATPGGGQQTYTWAGVQPGTFLYQSGSEPAKQVQMGLYGGVKVAEYPGVAFDQDILLVYSEVDAALHDPPAAANAKNYNPRYFLVNGAPFAAGQAPIPAGAVGQTVRLRLLNASLKSHVPTLDGAYLKVIAEDGRPYSYEQNGVSYPRHEERYAVHLAAGKTIDAIWQPLREGVYSLYDRSLHLTTGGVTGGGLTSYLSVTAAGAGAPAAAGDAYSVNEDTPLAVVAPGVLGNDTPTTAVASLVTSTAHGSLVFQADGSFTYTPFANYSGADSFTYRTADAGQLSNIATVDITVVPQSDPPVATADSATAVLSTPVTINVLTNDIDPDGGTLSVTSVTQGTHGSVTTDGTTVTYTRTDAAFTGTDTFTYTVSNASLSVVGTVSINVVASVNTAPMAMDDYAATTSGSPNPVPVTIDLVTNDMDAENNIDPTQVSVTTPTRGGSVQNMTNGTVIYTPKKNFQGTDTFTYTVKDTGGLTSNVATVRVNVTK